MNARVLMMNWWKSAMATWSHQSRVRVSLQGMNLGPYNTTKVHRTRKRYTHWDYRQKRWCMHLFIIHTIGDDEPIKNILFSSFNSKYWWCSYTQGILSFMNECWWCKSMSISSSWVRYVHICICIDAGECDGCAEKVWMKMMNIDVW
jgi:hypothetical protein